MQIEYRLSVTDKKAGLTWDYSGPSVEYLQTVRADAINDGHDVTEIELVET